MTVLLVVDEAANTVAAASASAPSLHTTPSALSSESDILKFEPLMVTAVVPPTAPDSGEMLPIFASGK